MAKIEEIDNDGDQSQNGTDAGANANNNQQQQNRDESADGNNTMVALNSNMSSIVEQFHQISGAAQSDANQASNSAIAFVGAKANESALSLIQTGAEITTSVGAAVSIGRNALHCFDNYQQHKTMRTNLHEAHETARAKINCGGEIVREQIRAGVKFHEQECNRDIQKRSIKLEESREAEITKRHIMDKESREYEAQLANKKSERETKANLEMSRMDKAFDEKKLDAQKDVEHVREETKRLKHEGDKEIAKLEASMNAEKEKRRNKKDFVLDYVQKQLSTGRKIDDLKQIYQEAGQVYEQLFNSPDQNNSSSPIIAIDQFQAALVVRLVQTASAEQTTSSANNLIVLFQQSYAISHTGQLLSQFIRQKLERCEHINPKASVFVRQDIPAIRWQTTEQTAEQFATSISGLLGKAWDFGLLADMDGATMIQAAEYDQIVVEHAHCYVVDLETYE